ncbi:MAG: hypothetical protein ABID09_03110 [Candidatus Omnitrophota bacterium]
MKRIRIVRKRKVYLLNALFLASAFLFYETHTNLFVKDFAEQRLEEMFPEGARVYIGNIEGGIFRDLVSENIRITPRKDEASINIKRIEIGYRMWYPLLKRIPAFKDLYDKRRAVLFLGEKAEDFMSGFFELEGTQDELNITGYLTLSGEEKLFLNGVIGTDKPSKFRVAQKVGTTDFEVERSGNMYTINGKSNHVKINGIDFISNWNISVDTTKSDLTYINVVFKNIILNYAPLEKDLEMRFIHDAKKDVLNVSRFALGDEIEGMGYLRLSNPRHIFLKWAITNLMLEDYFKAKKKEEGMSGLMNGNFTLKGSLEEPGLLAHCDVQDGYLGETKFDSIIMNLKGSGPVISIYDSRMRKEGGYIMLSGEIDLSKLKEDKAFDEVLYDADKDFFVWEGWSVKKEIEDSSVRAEKLLDDEFSISFKARTEETRAEEEQFLGVERKIKF